MKQYSWFFLAILFSCLGSLSYADVVFPGDGGGDEGYGDYPPGSPQAPSLARVAHRVARREQIKTAVRHLAQLRQFNTRRARIFRIQAGDNEWLDNMNLSYDFSFASFKDRQLNGSGHEREQSVFIDSASNNLQLGLGIIQNRYRIGGPEDILQHRYSGDFFLNYSLNDWFALGGFLEYAWMDVEDPSADGDHQVAGGLSASARYSVDIFEMGLTTSLTSSNKNSLDHLLDSEDTAWATMYDINARWNERFSSSLYTTYYATVDDQDTTDGSFWIWGGSVSYAPNDKILLSVGYETMSAYKGYHEKRLNAGVTYSW